MCIHVPYRSDLLLDRMELTPATSQIRFWLDDLGCGRATSGSRYTWMPTPRSTLPVPTKVTSRLSQVKQPDHPLDRPKSLSRNEQIILGILILALVGWLSSQCME